MEANRNATGDGAPFGDLAPPSATEDVAEIFGRSMWEPAGSGGVSEPASRADVEPGSADPVRLYLREMGKVSLLTREGEVRIAKRIEEAQRRVLAEVLSNAAGRGYFAMLGARLATDEVRLRDLLRDPTETDGRARRTRLRAAVSAQLAALARLARGSEARYARSAASVGGSAETAGGGQMRRRQIAPRLVNARPGRGARRRGRRPTAHPRVAPPAPRVAPARRGRGAGTCGAGGASRRPNGPAPEGPYRSGCGGEHAKYTNRSFSPA
jgi:hypothetical protein